MRKSNSDIGRAIRRAAVGACGVALALSATGCTGDEIACDSDRVTDRVIASARAQFPNDASKELMRRGSYNVFQRILKAHGLNENVESQREEAAVLAVKEMEPAYKGGRFTLEDIQTVKSESPGRALSCRARLMIMTSWGIAVRDITYDASLEGQGVAVKLDEIK